MNFESIYLLETLSALEKTIKNPGQEQLRLVSAMKEQITEIGKYHNVDAITVGLMREKGYDVSDTDSGILSKIAEHIDISDALWNSVESWAGYYHIKRIEEDGPCTPIDNFCHSFTLKK